MNNTFNFHRFRLVLRRQWIDFGKIYLMGIIVLTGVLAGFYAFNMPNPDGAVAMSKAGYLPLNFRYPLFFISGFLFITVIGSSYFSGLGQKSKAIVDLMIPASTLEKFLAGICYATLLGTLSYFIIFQLVDWSFCKYLTMKFDLPKYQTSVTVLGKTIAYSGIKAKTLLNTVDFEDLKYFIPMPFLWTSAFLLGSVYFNRFQYVKTAVVITVVMTVYGFIFGMTGDWITKDKIKLDIYSKQDEASHVLGFLFLTSTLLAIMFAVITYIRLKEKEV